MISLFTQNDNRHGQTAATVSIKKDFAAVGWSNWIDAENWDRETTNLLRCQMKGNH
jgi:hypothetical protein